MQTELESQQQLIGCLYQQLAKKYGVENCELIETHISWVILTGQLVYKIKKSINLGFLDFSSLEKRHFFCDEELRLNRRLAPEIYRAVVTISGSHDYPVLQGSGQIIEYALEMQQFPQSAQLDRMLENNQLTDRHMQQFAQIIARFHGHTDIAPAVSEFGDPDHVWAPMAENFKQIRQHYPASEHTQLLAELEQWSTDIFSSLREFLLERKRTGFIRECHGDMHLRNLAWVNEKPIVFDCIEFNENFRWIDVISEVGFLVMDLHDRGQPRLAQIFLNTYLEFTGDYAGLRIMAFYLVYRALVRAKVCAIRMAQSGLAISMQQAINQEFVSYLHLAHNYTLTPTPQLFITCGFSASGKSAISKLLTEHDNVIRIRSDIERKRLAGISAAQSAQAEFGEKIYSPDFSDRTYRYLGSLCEQLLEANYTVVVDAAFLQLQQRKLFLDIARQRKISFRIIHTVAENNVLRRRIQDRESDVSDADLNILEQQLLDGLPFAEYEQEFLLTIDTEREYSATELWQLVNANLTGTG